MTNDECDMCKQLPLSVFNSITEEYEKYLATKLASLGVSEGDIGSFLKDIETI